MEFSPSRLKLRIEGFAERVNYLSNVTQSSDSITNNFADSKDVTQQRLFTRHFGIIDYES